MGTKVWSGRVGTLVSLLNALYSSSYGDASPMRIKRVLQHIFSNNISFFRGTRCGLGGIKVSVMCGIVSTLGILRIFAVERRGLDLWLALEL